MVRHPTMEFSCGCYAIRESPTSSWSLIHLDICTVSHLRPEFRANSVCPDDPEMDKLDAFCKELQEKLLAIIESYRRTEMDELRNHCARLDDRLRLLEKVSG